MGGGIDALLSTAQMPGGVPVATLAVGKAGARNAAFLAAEILALGDESLARAPAAGPAGPGRGRGGGGRLAFSARGPERERTGGERTRPAGGAWSGSPSLAGCRGRSARWRRAWTSVPASPVLCRARKGNGSAR
ncbi:MAG: AIR carboxylase family protein [Thermoanaerobaculaceae bacterium]